MTSAFNFRSILPVRSNFAALDPDPVKDKKWDDIDKQIKERVKTVYDKTVLTYENIRKWLSE